MLDGIGIGLSQTRPIPRSPDDDKRAWWILKFICATVGQESKDQNIELFVRVKTSRSIYKGNATPVAIQYLQDSNQIKIESCSNPNVDDRGSEHNHGHQLLLSVETL